jgi:hypothetical protein
MTVSLIATSDFLQESWLFVPNGFWIVLFPFAVTAFIKTMNKASYKFRYNFA